MNPIRAALALVPLLVLTASTSFSMEPGAQDGHFKPGLPTQRARVLEDYGKLPLSFEANQGQTDTQVKFLSRGEGYSFFLKPSEAVMSLGGKSCPPSAKSDPKWLPVKTVETCANASGTVVRNDDDGERRERSN